MKKTKQTNITNSAYMALSKELAKHGLVSVYGEHAEFVRNSLEPMIEALVLAQKKGHKKVNSKPKN